MADVLSSGDVVKLKSGGPRMTVKMVDEPDGTDEELEILCQWFDDKHGVQAANFTMSMLKKIDS